MQPAMRPSHQQYSFNLEDRSKWKPLFCKRYSQEEYLICLGGVQQPLQYFTLNQEYYIRRARKVC